MLFLNVSNHPSAQWGGKQIGAAKRLALDPICEDDNNPEIIDVRFPDVDPSDDLDTVVAKAQLFFEGTIVPTIYQKVGTNRFAAAYVAAMVMGEPCFSFELTRLLEECGVPVYAATTQRVAEEKDGVKTSVFKFVRFRRITRRFKSGEQALIDLLEKEEKKEQRRKEKVLLCEELTALEKEISLSLNNKDYYATCPACKSTLSVPSTTWRDRSTPTGRHEDEADPWGRGYETSGGWADAKPYVVIAVYLHHKSGCQLPLKMAYEEAEAVVRYDPDYSCYAHGEHR